MAVSGPKIIPRLWGKATRLWYFPTSHWQLPLGWEAKLPDISCSQNEILRNASIQGRCSKSQTFWSYSTIPSLMLCSSLCMCSCWCPGPQNDIYHRIWDYIKVEENLWANKGIFYYRTTFLFLLPWLWFLPASRKVWMPTICIQILLVFLP